MIDPDRETWLRTPRLALRRPSYDDLDAIFDIHSDARTYEHAPHLRMRDRDQAAALLDAWLRSWTDLGFGYATVFADDALVGFCGVKPQRVVGREVMNLYYRFAPSAWGHGYAAEAAAAIADWSAAAHPSAPVLARMARNNPASQRVAERIGLTRLDLIDPEDEIPHWIYCSVAEGLRPAAL